MRHQGTKFELVSLEFVNLLGLKAKKNFKPLSLKFFMIIYFSVLTLKMDSDN